MALFRRKPAIDPKSETRDWELVSAIARDALKEQKKARRWSVFFKILTFSYLFFILIGVGLSQQKAQGGFAASAPHTAIVRINGIILDDQEANATHIIAGLRQAFDNEKAAAVMMVINSPGGSPVQAGYIYDEIRRLQAKHPDKKLYAVITELGASGGYYVAAAADEIYADKASLVGSIGVTAAGFGFVDLMEKIGVERRNFTAGEHKSFLDPYAPLKQDEKIFWESILDSTHQQFVNVVREGRGDRLVEDEQLFSGLIWNGEQAKAMGLIDGLGSPGYVAREIVGEETMRDYTVARSPFEELTRRFGVAIGMGLGKVLKTTMEPVLTLR
ncbi:MAG: S49 family peptidase [Cellvibrionaceae bacterium]|nr:S49 family peptidase [Cellvibrionaceae bacterium]